MDVEAKLQDLEDRVTALEEGTTAAKKAAEAKFEEEKQTASAE